MRNIWYIICCSLAILAVFFFLPDGLTKLKIGISVILGSIAWIKATAAIGHRWPEVRGNGKYFFFFILTPFVFLTIITISKTMTVVTLWILKGGQVNNILNIFPLVPMIIALIFLWINLINEVEKKQTIKKYRQ